MSNNELKGKYIYVLTEVHSFKDYAYTEVDLCVDSQDAFAKMHKAVLRMCRLCRRNHDEFELHADNNCRTTMKAERFDVYWTVGRRRIK